MPEREPVVRPAVDEDAAGLIELIGACFAEYPGCVLDVDREEPELRAIASAFAAFDGRFWVAAAGERVVASVGCAPVASGAALELKKLYVAGAWRRRGLGARLCALVETEARARGATRLELWSDTRFLDAHRLYERLGYQRGPHTRELHDLSSSVEYFYARAIDAPRG